MRKTSIARKIWTLLTVGMALVVSAAASVSLFDESERNDVWVDERLSFDLWANAGEIVLDLKNNRMQSVRLEDFVLDIAMDNDARHTFRRTIDFEGFSIELTPHQQKRVAIDLSEHDLPKTLRARTCSQPLIPAAQFGADTPRMSTNGAFLGERWLFDALRCSISFEIDVAGRRLHGDAPEPADKPQPSIEYLDCDQLLQVRQCLAGPALRSIKTSPHGRSPHLQARRPESAT